MDLREFKALELASEGTIAFTGTFWTVKSGTRTYRVDTAATFCTCEDFELTGKPCKHVLAVKHFRKIEHGVPLPLPADKDEREELRPKRPTCRQNWSAYNKAQCEEKSTFLRLLADLCSTIPEPTRPSDRKGRKPIPLRDAIFAAVSKVYSGFSTRRFTTDLGDCEEDGLIGDAPHYNHISKTLDKDITTLILRGLIVQSSLPLSAIETTFAMDSSGFGASRFVRWYDAKYGKSMKEHTWIKTHIACRVRTNIVTAVELGGEHDSQWFRELLLTTAQGFTVKEVVADKAYLSREIVEEVNRINGTAYIPFKSNNRPDKNGDVWKSLYHFFHLHRDEFLKKYHQRSNIESTFSMIKRKFGDSVRSKSDTAMNNEVLAKLLCYNIVVLVHEMHELGIDPSFGEKTGPVPAVEDDDRDEPRIIRFPGA